MLVPGSALASVIVAAFSPDVSAFALAWPVTTAALMLVIVGALTSRPGMRLTEQGIYGTSAGAGKPSRYGEWVPLGEIDRFEVRRWTPPPGGRWWLDEPRSVRTALSVRLIDGRYVALRFGREEPTRERWRPVILLRRSRSWRAVPALDPSGEPILWDASTDAAVAGVFNDRLAVLRPATGQLLAPKPNWPRGEDGRWQPIWLAQDVHRQSPPSLAYERRWLSEALDGSDPPVPPPAPRPVPPPLPAPEPAALPATWTRLELPARYWTLASERAGSVLGKRSSMVISAADVTFDRRWRRDLRVPLADIDRFDIVFERLPGHSSGSSGAPAGNWRLVLLLRDGAQVKLSGLDHGHFKQNRLFWSSCDAGSAPGEATGSMPWPNEQPLLVAARLNAHLELAGVANDSSSTTSTATIRRADGD